MANYRGPRRALLSRNLALQFPLRVHGVVAHLDWRRNRLWSASKGFITADQAVAVVRSDTTVSTAIARDGKITPFGSNKLRIGRDEGAYFSGSRQNTVKQNLDMSVSPWVASNVTVNRDYPWPFTTATPLHRVELPPGTTSWTVPKNWDPAANKVRCLGAGGNGAAGVAGATRFSGASGGSGGWAETSNIVLTPGSIITGITVPAGGSAGACRFVDNNGTDKVVANSGTNASGVTAGSGGSNTGAVGTLRRSGANGVAAGNGVADRGGVGGPGAPGPDGSVGAASGGNTVGGGGGSGPNGTGSGNSTASGANGGTGGNNSLGVGGGVGGTVAVAATDGTAGGAGAGGKSAVGINGSNGSNQVFSVTDTVTGAVLTYNGPGGGGGGGGLGGNGGNGGNGAGGGGGGATASVSGGGGLGGPGSIIITWGGVGSNRLTATADNATIKQTITNSTTADRASSSVLYLHPGVTLTGRIQLTQDDFATYEDVTDELVAGAHILVPGTVQSQSGNLIPGIRFTKAGDVIGCSLLGLETGDAISTPIVVEASSATRAADLVTLNLANFPGYITKNAISAFVVIKPGALPTPDPVDNSGWNTLTISSNYDIKADGVGYMNGSDTLTITGTGTLGNTYAVGDRINIGTGIQSFSDIAQILTGTGGVGTYRIEVDGVAGVAQTTPNAPGTSVGIVTRTKNLQRYVLNAAPKPDEAYQIRIGLTTLMETVDQSYGFDPQLAYAPPNVRHCLGFTVNAALKYGITFLNGDFDHSDSNPGHFENSPDPSLHEVLVLGTMGPDGIGAAIDGPMATTLLINGNVSEGFGSRLTFALKRAA